MGLERGTLGSEVWRSIDCAIRAKQRFMPISWNLCFKREKSKIIKLFVEHFRKTRDLNLWIWTLWSSVWRSINCSIRAKQRIMPISWNLCFKREKSKIIKLFVKTFRKTRDLNLGPLVLQPDTLPTGLSGLSRISCKCMGIYLSITENIVPHIRHFLPLEKFPPLGNRISLGRVPYTLALLGKGNCPLEIRFPSGRIFFHGKKMPTVWEIYILHSCYVLCRLPFLVFLASRGGQILKWRSICPLKKTLPQLISPLPNV